MHKKLLPIISVLMIAAFILAACGGGQPASTGPKTVTLWHAYQTGSAEEAALATIIENAKKAYPDWTIDVLQVPFDQIFNKYQTEVAAGGGPDLYVAPNDSLGDQVRAGLVADITDLVSGKLDKVTEQGVGGMTVEGKIYGVPESAKAVALYYNKDFVKDAPATTDDLLMAVKDGAKITLFNGAYHFFGWPGSFGGKLMDDTGKCIADQGGWVEAANYLLALKEAGAQVSTDYGAAEAPFRAGETAFWPNGPWALGDYKKDLGDKLGVVPLPTGTAASAPLIGIDGFYINPNSKEQQAAVDLALFLTNKESEQIYMDQAGHIPVRTDVTISDPFVQGFVNANSTAFVRPQSKEFSNFWTPFGDMWVKIMEGTVAPEQAVADACAAMNTANGK
jgi:arabinogalactan oligomer/maltooligosaccharide transport system substrate-binding protein